MNVGTQVTSGRRTGKVIGIDSRKRLLVMWAGSSVAGWNRPRTVRAVREGVGKVVPVLWSRPGPAAPLAAPPNTVRWILRPVGSGPGYLSIRLNGERFVVRAVRVYQDDMESQWQLARVNENGSTGPTTTLTLGVSRSKCSCGAGRGGCWHGRALRAVGTRN